MDEMAILDPGFGRNHDSGGFNPSEGILLAGASRYLVKVEIWHGKTSGCQQTTDGGNPEASNPTEAIGKSQ
ncbi:hypothetical protein O3V59_20515 [Brevibacillus thermoruber]|uniref:Uncharacterized protein n=1 Tax=Brevibacillus thermoruber TaxID=33942 RepID=A0A9X3TTK9_9BACL|nr:hypothetical protein [Brevibacillus thermoruber]MDA5110729.1 hypothetical protein [Brevibacillus thermoruber]